MAQQKRASKHRRAQARRRATRFLKLYNALYGDINAAARRVVWRAATDVRPQHTGAREGAGKVRAAFIGSAEVIRRVRDLLKERKLLTRSQRRQLDRILLKAAHYPGTRPDLSARRVEAESNAAAALDSWVFCRRRRPNGKCPPTAQLTPNQIEAGLAARNKRLERRQALWLAAKEIGRSLRPHLKRLVKLRNGVAREMGYEDFFALEVADYGLKKSEMMTLLGQVLTQTQPLYRALHCWVRHELAARYQKPAPRVIPAHWLPNRWNQYWPGLVPGVDLDRYFADKSPKWMVRAAEQFYVSMGFPQLPASFWKKSDLYPVAKGKTRRKNTHASAWHIDLRRDVRSLMSVVPTARWFKTAHHELGHIYYYLTYSNPRTPLLLRRGANRSYHEGIGELIAMASFQLPYLRAVGVIPPTAKFDRQRWLLGEALHSVVFLRFAAGVMSHFERDLYQGLPAAQWNPRWWKYVRDFQGIAPAAPRDAKTDCDACTKTHLINDPAQYYDYALATLLKYHLHRHICTKLLKQSEHACNYRGSKAVGDFLRTILSPGRAVDWRTVLRKHTGADLSAAAMLDYFRPLAAFLKKANAGRKCD